MSDTASTAATAAANIATPAEAKGSAQPANSAAIVGNQNATGAQTNDPLKEAAKEALKKFKVKVDNQEIEVDEDELKRGYGHQRAANKKLQEGLAAKKQAETFVQMMKDEGKLFEAIQKLGHDPRRLAEKYLAEQIQDELLDPREKELKEAQKKLKAYEEMDKRQKDAVQKQREDALKKKFSEDYTKQFVDALKSANVPQNKETVAEMAKYIHRAAQMGYQLTAEESAKLVREDIEDRVRRISGEADAETLVRLLGDQGLQKIRAWETSQLKRPEDVLKTPTEQPEIGTRKPTAGKRMTSREWRDYNRK